MRQQPGTSKPSAIRIVGDMCRQTNTINYSCELPLAQGIKFEI